MKTILSILAATALFSSISFAGGYGHSSTYKVTITNITKGITFTPVLAATHKSSISFFELGEPSSEALAAVAESGATAALEEVLQGLPDLVSDITTTGGLLKPGMSIEFEITSHRKTRYLSLAAMLLPTNDSFVALNTVALPWYGSRTYFARGYDAGSEPNDELCAHIPGPTCGGIGPSPDVDGEGYVFVSQGIHGEGDLLASNHDWRDAVAKVVVTKLK